MNKTTNFLTTITRVVNKLDTNTVKAAIGDSTDNNRTLTVNQVIRFLRRQTKSSGLQGVGVNLNRAYNVLRSTISTRRDSGRTDAIDINEFLSAYRSLVVNSSSRSRKLRVGRVINA